VTYEVAGHGAVEGLGSGMRRLMDEGTPAYGGWCMIPSAFVAEVVSASGCDWMCIDQQHGLIDDATMRVMVQAAGIRRTPVLVRVAWNDPAAIMRSLDAGADGVIVPMVNSRADAERAAGATRFPPGGFRSYGALRSAMAQPDFSPPLANGQSVCFVMIETAEAVQNVEEIVRVPGVDGVLVGPNDLCISYTGNNVGAASAPRDVEAIFRIGDACRRHGRAGALSAVNLDEAKRWHDAGFMLIGLPSDAALLGEGLARSLSSARHDR
jgi:4-hydroxy-2-oxoheptanedioate aldolase